MQGDDDALLEVQAWLPSQPLWRRPEKVVGDLVGDEKTPGDATDVIQWIDAGPLSKTMEADRLIEVRAAGMWRTTQPIENAVKKSASE